MERLDVLLVKKNMATSRERAKELIVNGQVTVNKTVVTKAAFQVSEEDELLVTGELLKYVSRGGLKLEKAIDYFNIVLSGKTCMDIGASTGGFTDCMLKNGAAKVYAVDVGTAQLAEKLKNDTRVISMEQTNIRYCTADTIGEKVDFISVDVSFISLTKVLGVVYELLKEDGMAVCLIKPQFEAGKQALNKKGVVTDKKTREKVVSDITAFADASGFSVKGTVESPIKGPEGNTEYLMFLVRI